MVELHLSINDREGNRGRNKTIKFSGTYYSLFHAQVMPTRALKSKIHIHSTLTLPLPESDPTIEIIIVYSIKVVNTSL